MGVNNVNERVVNTVDLKPPIAVKLKAMLPLGAMMILTLCHVVLCLMKRLENSGNSSLEISLAT